MHGAIVSRWLLIADSWTTGAARFDVAGREDDLRALADQLIGAGLRCRGVVALRVAGLEHDLAAADALLVDLLRSRSSPRRVPGRRTAPSGPARVVRPADDDRPLLRRRVCASRRSRGEDERRSRRRPRAPNAPACLPSCFSSPARGLSRDPPFRPGVDESVPTPARKLGGVEIPERVGIRAAEGAVVGKDLEVVEAIPAHVF